LSSWAGNSISWRSLVGYLKRLHLPFRTSSYPDPQMKVYRLYLQENNGARTRGLNAKSILALPVGQISLLFGIQQQTVVWQASEVTPFRSKYLCAPG
jgi:hypothetical protein